MRDFISRDAVKAHIYERAIKTALNNVGFKADASDILGEISKRSMDWIDEVPAADVRPVVRGEWEPNVRHDDCLVCSKCGCGYPAVEFAFMDCNRRSDERESAVFITDIMNFCPNCGADMREETGFC